MSRFNEAAAFQLRMLGTSGIACQSEDASMRPQRFSCGCFADVELFDLLPMLQ